MTDIEIEDLVRQATTSPRGALPLTRADDLRETLIKAGWPLPKQKRGAAGSKAAREARERANAENIELPRTLAAVRLTQSNREFIGRLTNAFAIQIMVEDLASHGHHVEPEALTKYWRNRLKRLRQAAGTSKPS